MLSHFRRITSTGKFIKYFTLESEVSALRKQLLFRSKNLGLKQLDILIGTWAEKNLVQMSKQQLNDYNQEILMKETPELHRELLSRECQSSGVYTLAIREYAAKGTINL